jgi:diguanylate cyclase (GGDEF)-like protein
MLGGEGWSRLSVRRSLRSLSRDERRQIVDAQVAATRPIISGVVASGAVILAVTGLFEGVGLAPDIGYPWWVIELVALAVAGCATTIWHVHDWRARLVLTLSSTLLLGIFISIPVPGGSGQLAIRTGLFQLLPIALLALLARPLSRLAMVLTMLGLAWLRLALHGDPATGSALYWLSTWTAAGFGLLLNGYLTDYAAANYRMRLRLRRQAHTDELTGLLNRAGWNDHVPAAYAAAVSRAQPVSFAFFDIDHFKAVNDVYGHEAGDGVLRMLGAIIKQRAGERSYAARFGGEEFVVVFFGHPAEAVEGFVHRVRQAFAEESGEIRATVSAGISHRQMAENMGQQLRRADVALYEAKAGGRDQMVVARA